MDDFGKDWEGDGLILIELPSRYLLKNVKKIIISFRVARTTVKFRNEILANTIAKS
jgi:hypothetical protein